MGQSMDFNGSSHYLDLGALAAFNGASKATFALWFRHNNTAWPGGTLNLLTRNQSGQRGFTISERARGGAGELELGIGNGSTIFSSFLPDLTFRMPWFHHLVFVFDSGTGRAYVNGIEVALQNPTGAYPSVIGTSSATIKIGATGSTPSGFYLGKMANVAAWAGFAATAAQAREIWGQGYGAIDYRAIADVPVPTFYVPGNVTPPVEVMGPITLGGGVSGTPSTRIPPVYVSDNAMFSHRQMLNEGSEPWLFLPDGSTPAQYSETPSIQRLDDGRLVWSYNRGTGHIQNNNGLFGFTDSAEALVFPIGSKRFPPDASGYVEARIPHGDLSQADSSKRSMTLSRIPEIGAHGRVFCVFNETDYAPGNPDRKVWVMYSDDRCVTWSTPYRFVDPVATLHHSVGRGRVVRRPDGKLIFGYYRVIAGEAAYDACIAISTDDGLTWAYYRTIAASVNRSSGCQFEEPYLAYVPGQGLRCQLRVDSGQDPRIEGGVALNGVILVSISTDDGDSWPVPVKAYDGRHHPIFIYRPSDGLMLAVHGASAGAFPPRVRISRNKGATWSDPQVFASDWTARNMQGDLFLTPGNRIAWIHAQEIDGVSATRMWCDIFRETWLRSIATP